MVGREYTESWANVGVGEGGIGGVAEGAERAEQ